VREGCRRRQTSDEWSSYGASREHARSAASASGPGQHTLAGDPTTAGVCHVRYGASVRRPASVRTYMTSSSTSSTLRRASRPSAIARSNAGRASSTCTLSSQHTSSKLASSSSATASRTCRTDNTISPTSAIPAREAPGPSVGQCQPPRPTRRPNRAAAGGRHGACGRADAGHSTRRVSLPETNRLLTRVAHPHDASAGEPPS
jgi:hypothetical protein